MRRTVLQTARLTTSALSHIGRRGRIRTLVDDFGDHSPRPLNDSPVLAERSGLEPHTFQYQPISSRSQYLAGLRSMWQRRLDSNQCMCESKSHVLTASPRRCIYIAVSSMLSRSVFIISCSSNMASIVADGVGFEPTVDSRPSLDFKSSSLNRSDTRPCRFFLCCVFFQADMFSQKSYSL